MSRKYTAITAARAAKLGLNPSRTFGYVVRIEPPISPSPIEEVRDLAKVFNTPGATRPCTLCDAVTPVNQLRDISVCGDWHTACRACVTRIEGPAKAQHWTGWYKFKADAVARAARCNFDQPHRDRL